MNTSNFDNIEEYTYRDTDFYRFDEYLFAQWTEKDNLKWGNALMRN